MSLLFRLLLVAAASLMVISGGEATAASDAYNSSICQKSYTCGGLVIHYPFYMSNESKVIDRVAYSYCGYPGMAILCDKSSATLQLGGGTNYTVLAIDYSNHTITLADADALASDCPRVRHNVTIPPEAWLNFTTPGNNTISFFLDCAFTAANTPPQTGIIPINCSSFVQGHRRSWPHSSARRTGTCPRRARRCTWRPCRQSGSRAQSTGGGWGAAATVRCCGAGSSSAGTPEPGHATSARCPGASVATTRLADSSAASAPTVGCTARTVV